MKSQGFREICPEITRSQFEEKQVKSLRVGEVTVLMSVYANTKAEDLAFALKSLQAQTRPPERILVVLDGPIAQDVHSLLNNVDTLPLEENVGLGKALAAGLRAVDTEFVARLDSDDAAFPHRIETQLSFLSKHPDISVVGSSMREFNEAGHGNIRKLPESPSAIAKYVRLNSPMNHPSVMFRTADVLAVGGYRDLRGMEDYDLWARMISQGKKLYNLPEPLTYFRVDQDQFRRRSANNVREAERELQTALVQYGLVSPVRARLNFVLRNLYRALPLHLMQRAYGVLFHRSK
ncbi:MULTISPECIES: glycosyltransferase [Corynebacterium]|nr:MULTISPECIES: glycosyltransferase [Corynebacterium]MCG7256506.1 glycosyltransferase [Corynebacterium hadale]MCG7264852.1 glycosyltransferase [Corynebacterium hadale]